MKSVPTKWNQFFCSDFQEVPSLVASSYLPSIDGLRAISITIVICGHLMLAAGIPEFINAAAGVEIFFAISGFLITTLLLKEKIKTGRISLKRFYIRRFLRIFPVAYLYLFVLFLLNIALNLRIHGTSFGTAFLYMKNFTLLDAGEWQTGHFWSLAVEEQFYFFFPFILVLNWKVYIRLLIFLIVLSPVTDILLFHPVNFLRGPVAHDILKTMCDIQGKGSPAILWGSLTAVLLMKGMIPLRRLGKWSRLGIWILVCLELFNNRVYFNFPMKETINMVLFAPAICVVLLSMIQPNGTLLYRFLNIRLLMKIGVLSYSLYIWQQIFTFQQPWQHAFSWARSVWVNLPALFLTAYCSYTFYEKKFLLLKNRFKPRAVIAPQRPGNKVTGKISERVE